MDYTFNDEDDAACRENFLIIEENYLTTKDQSEEDAIELRELYQTILDIKNENSIELIDNQDFVNDAITFGNDSEIPILSTPTLPVD